MVGTKGIVRFNSFEGIWYLAQMESYFTVTYRFHWNKGISLTLMLRSLLQVVLEWVLST